MSIGEGVVGADLNVTPTGIEELSENLGSAKKGFEDAAKAIDAEIMGIAGKAMGEDSTDYQAFVSKYKEEMQKEAQEIVEELESHARKAQTTAESAAETIQKNIGVIG